MSAAENPANWRFPRRVAYVVSHSQPWSSNGYALRSDAVARALQAAGHEVIVFSRPGRPWDIEGFPGTTNVTLDQRIDGLRHIALPMPPMPGAATTARIRAAADILTEAFRAFRPAAVIAASNWENAEPARRAASRTGATFFYEQRGFWEMSGPKETEAELRDRAHETEVALAARAVFTLNALMRDALVARGVPRGRIHLVPNGVSLRPATARKVTRASVGCSSRYLLGYIGSLSAYEGVEDLLRLTARLRQGEAALDVDALIVGSDAPKGLLPQRGDGKAGQDSAQAGLRRLAQELGIAKAVHFVAQLPEAEAAAHYPICDAIVLPRRRTRVTELVPPLKPYTAAEWSLPVFMTDLPPLAEVAAEINGTLFAEGDLDGLAAMVRKALTEGHPATITPLASRLAWTERVLPIREHLNEVAETERGRNHRLMAGFATSGATDPDATGMVEAGGRFDLNSLPSVGLRAELGGIIVAYLGPVGRTAVGQMTAGGGEATLMRLSRANMLDVLATAEPGRLVIDWAGLQEEWRSGSPRDSDEWIGLWSIDDMRLNRQVMDGVRIALQRGWRVQVIGPVHRSQAPLYRSIAEVVEEIRPGQPAVSAKEPSAPAADMAEGRA